MKSASTSTLRRPRIALTLGDLSGIGPELVAKLIAQSTTLQRADIFVLATEEDLAVAANEADVSLSLAPMPSERAAVALPAIVKQRTIELGTVSRAAGERALADLSYALALYQDGAVDAILFAPLNKSALAHAGMEEEDELRWFATQMDLSGPTSELNFATGLVTARVTSHIPMKDVARNINSHGVVETCALLDRTLRAQGIEAPRLAVCALNPHAGENGKFGSEEIDDIRPGIEQTRAAGIDASGPYPSDTVFIDAFAGKFDGVVTMYHDQGQIALKLHGFDEGVTVLGGLPLPIVTPAHGTAHAIAGQGRASTRSIERAFDIAVNLASQHLADQALASSAPELPAPGKGE